MGLREIIRDRISIRAYKDTPIPEEMLAEILRNGDLAPSAGNLQPWEFIIIKNKDTKAKVIDGTYMGRDDRKAKKQLWMIEAPILIVVCGDSDKLFKKYGEYGSDVLLYLSCSACIENMLLTIEDLGLSSCYVAGLRPHMLQEALDLPSHIIPMAVLPVGYANEEGERRPKEDIASRIHYEKYSTN